MDDRRILILSIYPIAQPRFGGPLRSRAIYGLLRRSFSSVRYLGVHPGWPGVTTGPDDVAVSAGTAARIALEPYLADLICGQAIYSDDAVRRHVLSLLDGFRPDTIVLEQVYPFLGLSRLLHDLGLSPKLVYSSQNIEHQMKPPIYESYGVATSRIDQLTATIRQAEADLAAKSDLVVAVTQDDLAFLSGLGARRTVLAPNGAAPLVASPAALHRHLRLLARRDVDRSVVFVSSAHQPNWQGFVDMIGTRLGFLTLGTRVLLCGSVCDLIGDRVSASDVENATFWHRATKLGTLTDEDLAAALLSASLVVLPITHGGGSNLKTAEALLSGIPIVATRFAFRGYEDFLAFPGVRLADSPEEFRKAMADPVLAERAPRTASHVEQLRGLHWGERLAGLVEAMASL